MPSACISFKDIQVVLCWSSCPWIFYHVLVPTILSRLQLHICICSTVLQIEVSNTTASYMENCFIHQYTRYFLYLNLKDVLTKRHISSLSFDLILIYGQTIHVHIHVLARSFLDNLRHVIIFMILLKKNYQTTFHITCSRIGTVSKS